MPRTVNPELRESRRKEILASAILIFSRQGFTGTTVSEIAKAAGVSHATVFQYFATKEELFRTAILENVEKARGYYRQLKPDSPDPAERLRFLVEQQMAIALNSRAYFSLVHQVIHQPDPDRELVSELDAFAEEFIRFVAGQLEVGQNSGTVAPGDAVAAAKAYFAYWNGVGLVIRDGDDKTVKELTKHGLRLLGVRGNF